MALMAVTELACILMLVASRTRSTPIPPSQPQHVELSTLQTPTGSAPSNAGSNGDPDVSLDNPALLSSPFNTSHKERPRVTINSTSKGDAATPELQSPLKSGTLNQTEGPGKTVSSDKLSAASKMAAEIEVSILTDLYLRTSGHVDGGKPTSAVMASSGKKDADVVCLENKQSFQVGEIVKVGQIGNCCFFWYCGSAGKTVYHEIPCFERKTDQSDNMCLWHGESYQQGSDILIENVDGMCHGIHCTCDGQVIDLHGFECNVTVALPDFSSQMKSSVRMPPVT